MLSPAKDGYWEVGGEENGTICLMFFFVILGGFQF